VKFSYNWIRELVPGLSMSPVELARLITMKTAECEGVEEFAPHLARVVAARVIEAHRLEGTHLTRAIVDAGPLLGRKQVICGAPNCRAGMTTAYVPDGVWLGSKEIRRAVIHGVASREPKSQFRSHRAAFVYLTLHMKLSTKMYSRSGSTPERLCLGGDALCTPRAGRVERRACAAQ